MRTKYKIYVFNWIEGVEFPYPLLDNDLEGEVYYLKNPKLIKEVNALEQLTFTIYPNHPYYSQLFIKESVIKVYQETEKYVGKIVDGTYIETEIIKEIIFKGKIIKEKINFDNSKNITCEGLLGTLADNRFNDIGYLEGILEAGGYMMNDIFNCGFGENEEYLHHGWFEEVVINYNNEFCKAIDQLKIKEVCPSVPKNSSLGNYLRYHFDFYRNGTGGTIKALEPVLEQIKDKTLLEILNYLIEHGVYWMEEVGTNPYPLKYFVPTYDENNTYLNIYTDHDLKTQMNEQKIVFGENMIDLAIEQDSNNIVTAIIPTGVVSVPDGEGNMTEEEVALTYWSGSHQYENNEDIYLSRKFMYSKSGVDKYGWILGDLKNSTFNLGWSQGSDANQLNLQREAANYLSGQGSRIKETITINAADLSYATGYDIEAFQFLKYVTISAPKHLNKNLDYLITKIELNLVEPEKNKITFNQSTNTTTGSSSSTTGGSGGGNTGISGNVTNTTSKENQDYSNLQNDINNIKANYATNAYVNSTFPTNDYVNSTFATSEYVSAVETEVSSYIDQQAEAILASVKEDTSITKTATYYQVVSSTEEGALQVVADSITPTETQIKIGDLASCDCDVEVGDYVILITASMDYEALKQTVQSLVAQTSDAVQLNFLTETVLNAINAAAGEVDSKYSFVNNYFRFDADGSLLIGTVNNPFILKLTNDRISFIEDNVEIAYISNNKLYITDGEFLNSLQLGNFAFTPRTNGNLSFKLK